MPLRPIGDFEATFTSDSADECKIANRAMSETLPPATTIRTLWMRSVSPRCQTPLHYRGRGRHSAFLLDSGKLLNHYKPFLPSPPDRIAVSPDGSCLAVVASIGFICSTPPPAPNASHSPMHFRNRRRCDSPSTGDTFCCPATIRRPAKKPGNWPPLAGDRLRCRQLRTGTRNTGLRPRVGRWPIPRNARRRHAVQSVRHLDSARLEPYGTHSWSVKKGLPGRNGYGFSADGLRLCVVEDKGLAVYDSATGRLVELLPYTTPLTKREWAGAVAFTPDGVTL